MRIKILLSYKKFIMQTRNKNGWNSSNLKQRTQGLFVVVHTVKKNNRRPFFLLIVFLQFQNQHRYHCVRSKVWCLRSEINEFNSQEKIKSEYSTSKKLN